jgi:hypothetical protein
VWSIRDFTFFVFSIISFREGHFSFHLCCCHT